MNAKESIPGLVAKQHHHYYQFGSFRLDPRSRILLKEGERLPLTPRMFDLLQYFVEHAEVVLSQDQLLDRLWSNVYVTNAVLVQNIAALRRVLGRQEDNAGFIETIPKRGYRFIAPVETGEALPTYEPRRAIAILPFKDASSDAADPPPTERDFLSVSLADSLSLRLGRFRDIAIRPVASVMSDMIDVEHAVEAGHKLNVNFVVTGEFSVAGDAVSITVDLLRVSSERSVWREEFVLMAGNAISIERKIVKRIHQEVVGCSRAPASGKSLAVLTPNFLAHRQYLRGRYFWNRRTTDDLHKAIECFQNSVKLDPEFGLAYSGLCDCFTQLINIGSARPAEAIPRAREAAFKAVELSPEVSECHASNGYILAACDWDWLAAEEEFLLAVELNPNNVTVRHWLATLYVVMQQRDKAMAALEDARESDPLSPILGATTGMNLYFLNDLERAEQVLTAVLELEPSFAAARLFLGRVYHSQNRYPEAVDEFSLAHDLFQTSLVEAELAAAMVLAGRKDEGLNLLEGLLILKAREYVSPYALALIYEALGERKKVHAMLDEAFDERCITMMWCAIEPRLALVRETPFGQDLMRRVNYLPLVR